MNITYVLEPYSSPLDELSPGISCPPWHPLAMSPRSAYDCCDNFIMLLFKLTILIQYSSCFVPNT